MTLTFSVKTDARTQFLDITDQVRRQMAKSGLEDGILMVYVPHTTAGVTINEGADPDVQRDIIDTLNEIVPWDRPYRHAEGNSPAHIKASLMGASVTVPVEAGRLQLGTWQSIFFCEFDGPRTRKIQLKTVSS